MAAEVSNPDSKPSPIRFRNYRPRSRRLREHYKPREGIELIEKKLEEDLTKSIDDFFKQDVLSLLAPKKPNWDLKRDVERKYSKILKEKTDLAILQLMRMSQHLRSEEERKIAEAEALKKVDLPDNEPDDDEEEEEDTAPDPNFTPAPDPGSLNNGFGLSSTVDIAENGES